MPRISSNGMITKCINILSNGQVSNAIISVESLIRIGMRLRFSIVVGYVKIYVF